MARDGHRIFDADTHIIEPVERSRCSRRSQSTSARAISEQPIS